MSCRNKRLQNTADVLQLDFVISCRGGWLGEGSCEDHARNFSNNVPSSPYCNLLDLPLYSGTKFA